MDDLGVPLFRIHPYFTLKIKMVPEHVHHFGRGKIIFQDSKPSFFGVPAVKFLGVVHCFLHIFVEVFQQCFSTVSKYVPLAKALVAQIHQHSMHVSCHSVRLPSPASFSCNCLEKSVLHFCTCLLYLYTFSFLAFSHLSFFHHFLVFQFFLWNFAYSKKKNLGPYASLYHQ